MERYLIVLIKKGEDPFTDEESDIILDMGEEYIDMSLYEQNDNIIEIPTEYYGYSIVKEAALAFKRLKYIYKVQIFEYALKLRETLI